MEEKEEALLTTLRRGDNEDIYHLKIADTLMATAKLRKHYRQLADMFFIVGGVKEKK
jgi:hypothetical protein